MKQNQRLQRWLAYVFAKQGEPDEKFNSPDEWLDQFSTFSIYEILPELISLWGMNVQQQEESKKTSSNR